MPKSKLGFEYTCQHCKKRVLSTRHREVYLRQFVGPCADSFCYASCDSPSCKPIHVTICDGCLPMVSLRGEKK